MLSNVQYMLQFNFIINKMYVYACCRRFYVIFLLFFLAKTTRLSLSLSVTLSLSVHSICFRDKNKAKNLYKRQIKTRWCFFCIYSRIFSLFIFIRSFCSISLSFLFSSLFWMFDKSITKTRWNKMWMKKIVNASSS